LNITKGRINLPDRTVLYGQEGVGKSMLAAEFPEPVFVDLEDGTENLDVARVDKPATWTALLQSIAWLTANPGTFKTTVIDTADWAQHLCDDHVRTKYPIDGVIPDSLAQYGWNNGWKYMVDEWQHLLEALNDLRKKTGMQIVLVCHASIRKFEPPEHVASGPYDRWELKLARRPASEHNVHSVTMEWADNILFCAFSSTVAQTERSKKAVVVDEKRVLRTRHCPQWDAKNRHGMAAEVPLHIKSLDPIFREYSSGQHGAASSGPRDLQAEAKAQSEPLVLAGEQAPAGPSTPQPVQAPSQPQAQLEPQAPPPPAIGPFEKLGQLMENSGISQDDLMLAILPHEKLERPGYFPAGTQFSNLPEDFVLKITADSMWDNVVTAVNYIKENG